MRLQLGGATPWSVSVLEADGETCTPLSSLTQLKDVARVCLQPPASISEAVPPAPTPAPAPAGANYTLLVPTPTNQSELLYFLTVRSHWVLPYVSNVHHTQALKHIGWSR